MKLEVARSLEILSSLVYIDSYSIVPDPSKDKYTMAWCERSRIKDRPEG